MPWDYRGKRVLILGLARSGISAARLLSGEVAELLCADEKEDVEIPEELKGLSVRLGPFTADLLAGCDEVVLSPGIPANHGIVKEAVRREIPVISELELGYRFARGEIIAVTGTNGKSTTVSMIERVLREGGYDAVAAGNIGKPFCSVVKEAGRERIFVIEASSFQLETISRFRPRVAGVLNVTPDHLDRYGSVEDYYSAKARIVLNCESGDHLFYNASDPRCAEMAERFPGATVPFSSSQWLDDGLVLKDGKLVVTAQGEVEAEIMDRDELRVIGLHNVENALAAAAAVRRYNLPVEVCAKALSAFPGLAHRMEKIATIEGVDYYNDSKATNVEGAVMSLKGLQSPVVLIAGGLAKGSDFSKLLGVSQNILHAVVLGEAAGLIEQALEGSIPVTRAANMRDAVYRAKEASSPGSYVVLSPACASFDMFRDYRHRGDVFRNIVEELKNGTLTNEK